MKKNLCHRLALLLLLGMFTCTFSGCQMYDWLVQWIQKSFASDHDYDVSVVDCKHFQDPDSLFEVSSSLSLKINSGIRQAVKDVALQQNCRNITLADKIPYSQFDNFHQGFFGQTAGFESRAKMLRAYCDKYETNIIMWGATMGDDYEITFIGWLYRRDLNTVAQTNVIHIKKNESERIAEKKVQDVMRKLLDDSLNNNPIGVAGSVAKDMNDNKELILEISTAVLLRWLSGG